LNTYYPTESGAALSNVKFAIDSGYATPEVYAWTRRYVGPRAIVIKGDSGAAPISQPSPVDVGPQGIGLRLVCNRLDASGGKFRLDIAIQ